MAKSTRDELLAFVKEQVLAEVVRDRFAALLPEVEARLSAAFAQYENQALERLAKVRANADEWLSDVLQRNAETNQELANVEARTNQALAQLASNMESARAHILKRQARVLEEVAGTKKELDGIAMVTGALLDEARQRATQAEERIRLMRDHTGELEAELKGAGRGFLTQAKKRADLAFALAFIPDLPTRMPPSDWEVVFSFARIKAEGVLRRPSPEAVALKWEEFCQLAEPEQMRVARLLRSIAKKYRLTADVRLEQVVAKPEA